MELDNTGETPVADPRGDRAVPPPQSTRHASHAATDQQLYSNSGSKSLTRPLGVKPADAIGCVN